MKEFEAIAAFNLNEFQHHSGVIKAGIQAGWIPGSLGVTEEMCDEFAASLRLHVTCVVEAGLEIGVEPERLEVHDRSKWSIDEFPAYTKNFHGGGCPNEFARAWLHHIHVNDHHWQHWMFPDGFTPHDSDVINGCVEMPEPAVREMVADWMGASKAYKGHWDMTGWLKTNLPKIKVHPNTAKVVRQILAELGYQEDIAFLI